MYLENIQKIKIINLLLKIINKLYFVSKYIPVYIIVYKCKMHIYILFTYAKIMC